MSQGLCPSPGWNQNPKVFLIFPFSLLSVSLRSQQLLSEGDSVSGLQGMGVKEEQVEDLVFLPLFMFIPQRPINQVSE